MSTYIIWGSEINRLRDAINAMEAQLSERAARIEALEAALQEIITRGGDYDHPYAEELARAALGGK